MRGFRDVVVALCLLLAFPSWALADWRQHGDQKGGAFGAQTSLDAAFAFEKGAAARAGGGDPTVFSIALRARGRLFGEVDFASGAVRLGFVGRNGQPRPVRAADKAAFSALLDDAPDLVGDYAQAFDAAVSTLLIAPVDKVLDFTIQASAAEGDADGRAFVSMCASMGKSVVGSYTDAADRVVKKAATLNGCLNISGACLGRCGTGCRGPGAPGRAVLRYTRDCLALDLCSQAFGQGAAACSDEATRAMDDLWKARDCASMTGTWSGLGGSMQVVEQNIAGGSVTIPLTGTISYGECRYSLQPGSGRSREYAGFTLTAARIAGRPSECCGGGTMKGALVATGSTCNLAKVTVSSFCGGATGALKKR